MNDDKYLAFLEGCIETTSMSEVEEKRRYEEALQSCERFQQRRMAYENAKEVYVRLKDQKETS